MKIVFFGSDDFADVHLKALLAAGHTVVLAVTQPDRPKGRGLKMSISPIKLTALEADVPVIQPGTLKDPATVETLRAANADVFVVIAYGQFLPQAVLDLPRKMCLNVHGSLLPQYRGAAPINWAILHGKTQTGVTIIRMNAGMDSGEICAQSTLSIGPNTTAVELRAQMAQAGAELLLETLRKLGDENITLTPQDPNAVSFAPKLSKDLSPVDWTKSAVDIHNHVRGLQPWPSAVTTFNGKPLKILTTRVLDTNPSAPDTPGTVTAVGPQGLAVATGRGIIQILSVHPESGKPMDATSFAAGYRVSVGERFGT